MMDNSILSELEGNADTSALMFKDMHNLLIRLETHIAFQKAVEAEVGVERAGEPLYARGFTSEQRSGQQCKEVLGFTDATACGPRGLIFCTPRC